jgi:hypothetical protein
MSERKSPVDLALDLFVYAPLGLVLNIEEVLPNLVERGHQQVNMARMFGQFAVQTGTKEARKRLEGVANGGRPSASKPTPAPTVAEPVVESVAVAVDVEVVPPATELAITDYDSLSASQVVPRLDGLSAEERDAVRRYEAAHRGRKTILSKLNQLH